jgi:hypothetical protein
MEVDANLAASPANVALAMVKDWWRIYNVLRWACSNPFLSAESVRDKVKLFQILAQDAMGKVFALQPAMYC